MDSQMEDAPLDVQGASSSDDVGPLLLSDSERKLLELYDRLQELQLEIALLKAQQNHQPSFTTSTEEEVQKCQNEVLNSRATYVLRQEVVESVLTARPILNAVHGASDANPIENDLLPYIERRDSTSIASLKKTSDLQKAQNELVGVESESLRSGRENVRLTAELLDLIREKNRNKAIEILDESSRAEIDRLEQAVRSSRRKWRVVKGTTSAIVAGSGVDWVKDAELRDIVLDMEDDGV